MHQLDIGWRFKTACGEDGGNLWRDVEVLINGVGSRELENTQGRGSPPKLENRACQLDIGGGCETACGEGGGDLCCEVDILFEEVSGWELENKQGRGITPKPEY